MIRNARGIAVDFRRCSSVGAVSRPRQPVAKGKVGKRGGMERERIEGEQRLAGVNQAKQRKLELTGYAIGFPSTENSPKPNQASKPAWNGIALSRQKSDLPNFRRSDILLKPVVGGTAKRATRHVCHPPTFAGG